MPIIAPKSKGDNLSKKERAFGTAYIQKLSDETMDKPIAVNKLKEFSNWESGAEYTPNSFVFYNNNLYKCITAHTSEIEFDSKKFIKVTKGGEVEDWEAGKTYKVNQLVKSDSKLYICMNEHTSSSAFATDLLAGNWAFIGGAGYSNVIMDTIYEGDVQVTAITGNDTYTLASSADNYDYVICTVKITQTSGILVKATVVVPANSIRAISWSYGIGSGNAYIETYGWVAFSSDKTSINFALRAKGSAVASVSLERVDGIKVNTMTLSEIAELSMPSGVKESIAGVGSSTVEYLCPANGYVFASCLSGIATASNRMTGQSMMTPSVTSYYSNVSIICKKGDVVAINLRGSSPSATFCYSVGSAKELGLI